MRYSKFLAGLFCLILICSFSDAAKSAPRVRIIRVEGHAEVLKLGSGAWDKAVKGVYLNTGDSVKTKRESSCDIAFDSTKDNVVNVRPLSHVVIKLEGNERIRLVDGEVFALIRGLSEGSSFEIRTPSAVCGARGTGFGAAKEGASTVASAYEDDIYTLGLKKDGTPMPGELDVEEGYESIVRGLGRPGAPTKIGREKYKKWDKWRDGVGGRSQTKTERLVKGINKIEEHKERIDERISEDRIRRKDEGNSAGTGRFGGGTSEQ